MSARGIWPNYTYHRGWMWVMLAITCVGTLLTVGSVFQTRKWMKTDLQGAARRIAHGVDSTALQALAGDESDLDLPAYTRTKQFLSLVRLDNPDFRFVYLMGRTTEGQIFFFADSEPPDSEDESGPGDPFPDANEEEHLVLDTGTTLAFDPTEDQWGIWASAYAPVVDPATGHILAILGLDIAASDWHRHLLLSAVPPAALTLTLLLLALLLAHRAAKRKAQPHRAFLGIRDEELTGIILLGLLTTAYAAWFTHRIEQHNVRHSLQRMAESELAYRQQKLRTVQTVRIPAFTHLLQIKPDLSEAEFRRFAAALLPDLDHSWIWAPAVHIDNRDLFEQSLKELYGETAILHEHDAAGAHRPAEPREVFFPIQFIAAVHENAPAPGFDLASLPHLQQAIQQAQQTRLPTASPGLDLSTPDGYGSPVMVINPVFLPGNPEEVHGLLVNVSHFQSILGQTNILVPLRLHAHELDHGAVPQPLHSAASAPASEVVGYFHLFGRTYRLNVHPHNSFHRLYPQRAGFTAAAMGLVITAALAVLVGYPRRHRRVLERLVRRRTEQLSENQLRYEMLTRQARTFIWEVNEEGLYTYVSDVIQEVLGYQPEEIVGHKYFYELAPTEDRDALRKEGLASIRVGETVLNHENRMISKEGRIVWVQTSGVSLLRPDGTRIFRGSDTDITSRKEAEAELRQWDRLLQATASGAQQLLAAPDLEVAVPSVLRTIGEACNQDRIYIFERFEDEASGEELISQRYEWVREGITPEIDNPTLQNLPINKYLPRWAKRLARGEPIVGLVATFPESERALLEPQGIRSMLAVPIFVDNRFWGLIGIDNCTEEHQWSDSERALLTTAATAIGTAIARRRAAWTLEDALARNNALLNALPDMIFVLNRDGTIVDFNTHDNTVLYAQPSAFLGQPLDAVIPPELVSLTRQRIEEVARTGNSVEYTYTLKIKDAEFEYESRMVPCGNNFLALVRDVTEQRRQLQELHRLSTAIEQSPNTIVITNHKGTIVYVNPSFERVTGYSREEALNQNPRVLKSGQHDRHFYEAMWKTISAGNVWTGNLINKRKNGEIFTEEASIAPVRDADGKVTHYVAIKRDITHELEQQEMLRQAQKMDSIGRLAGGIAHDFNNLLGVILGNTELAMAQLDDYHPVREDLEEIRVAAKRSADLTRQLLGFARRQTVQPVVIELNETVAGMLRMLRRLIDENIKLEWIPHPKPSPILIDPSQLDQILVNLCVNARDAIKGTGEITIETRRVHLTVSDCRMHKDARPGDYMVISIHDTGHGMDPETMAQIFEPFFTTKQMGKGTGLGLATVYGIVSQNGGFIDVESRMGAGTTFNVYLPRHDVLPLIEEALATTTTVNALKGTEQILLVEDEPGILSITMRMLRQQGYHVLGANGPEEGIALTREHQGDLNLLITDVIMPHTNGREMYEQIRSFYPNLKCLFMSGYSAEIIAHNSVVGDNIHFLQKPFTLAQLAAAVRKALDFDPLKPAK